MCSTPSYSMPELTSIQTPIAADSSNAKSVTKSRRSAIALSNRNINTSALGILSSANTNQKKLLGE